VTGLDVTVSAVVAAPPGEVGSYVFDPLNDPEWIGGIREARWLTEPPLRVGSRVERVARFAGRRVEYVLEVTELEAPSRIRMRSVRAPFPMDVAYGLEDASPGCRVSIRVGGGGWAQRLARPLVRRNLERDLRNLKRRFATQSSGSSSVGGGSSG